MLCRMLKTEVHHLFMPPHSYGEKKHSLPYDDTITSHPQ